MNRITASRTPILLQCQGAPLLPWVESSSAAAEDGTRKHAMMDRRAVETDAEHIARIDSVPECRAAWDGYVAFCEEEGILAHEEWHEEAFGLDLEARHGIPLNTDGHRNYGDLPAHVLPGTADLIAFGLTREGRRVLIVADWKFGQERVEAASSPQLATLMAAVATSKRFVEFEELHALIVQAPPGCERAFVSARTFSRTELATHIEALAEAAAVARRGELRLQRGPECKYCPAQLACPAQLSAMSAIIAPAGPGPVTRERAGEIWLELRQAKKRLELIEDEIKAMATAEPVPLPGGKRLVSVTRTRSSMDAKALEAVARFHGASDSEIAECAKATSYTTTQEVKA